MNVGFHIHYHNRDQTIAALSMAQQAMKAGHDVQLLSRGTRAQSVDYAWDGKIISYKKTGFWDWSLKKDIMVWTDVPKPEQVIHAKRYKCKTVIVAFWEDIVKEHEDALRLADVVACPLVQAGIAIRNKWDLPKIFYWPLDLDIPYTKKDKIPSNRRLRLLIPLCGSQMYQTTMDIFNVIQAVAKLCPDVDITVLASKKFIGIAKVSLSQLTRDQPNIKTVYDPNWNDQLRYLADADLVVRAGVQDGCGLLYLAAASLGTPVITYDCAPITEFANSRMNNVLIPCEVEHNWLGVTAANPDYMIFAKEIADLIRNPDLLNKLHKNVSCELNRNSKLSWDGLLSSFTG